MATGSGSRGVFYEFYDRYVADVRTAPQVYGYGVLVAAWLAGLAAVSVYAADRADMLGLAPVAVRELALLLGAIWVVGLVLGAVLQLPLTRGAVAAAAFGGSLSLAALAYFVQVYPAQWGLGRTEGQLVALGYVGGLGVIGLVAALVPVATGRRSFLTGDRPASRSRTRLDDRLAQEHSAVLAGESSEDGVFAVFGSDAGWRWRFVEQSAVADGRTEYVSAAEAADALVDVKGAIDDAGLMEVTHPAIRLHSGTEATRWRMVDGDGVVLAASPDAAAHETAEAHVNLLKEHGPEASLLDADEGAFEVYGGGDTWRWRLVDGERTALGAGSDTFEDRTGAESAVGRFRSLAADAPLMDVEGIGFELRERDDEWRWRIVDENDDVLGETASAAPTREAAEDAIARLAEGAIEMSFVDAGSPAYEVVAGEDGGWRWRLVDETDAIVAHSDGAVPSAESGRSVVDRVKSVAADAPVMELDDAEFEVYADGDDWAWRLVTSDRETVAHSPPDVGFGSPADAEGAIDGVRTAIDGAERIAFDSAAFHLYEAEGAWNWRLIDEDGTIVSDSGTAHASREDAAAAMNTMKEHAPEADLVEIDAAAFERYQSGDDGWHWRLVDAAGETLATSAGSFETTEAADDAMDSFELLGPDAETRRMPAAIYQVYVGEGEPRQWRWRLVHPDGNVLATSEDGFPDRETATDAAERVAAFADEAPVHTIEDLAVRISRERPGGDDDGADDDRTDGQSDADRGDDAAASDDGTAQWRWEIVDRDRETLVVGTDRFPDRDAAASTARVVRDNAGAGSVFAVDPAAFRFAETADGWQWRLVDRDRTVLAAAESFAEDRPAARASLDRVRELASDADVLAFDRAAFEVASEAGNWRWRYVDTSGTALAESGRVYETRDDATAALDTVRDCLTAASVFEVESPTFELHDVADDGWRWELVGSDGSPLAESMDTYPSRDAARRAVARLRSDGPAAATRIAG